MTKAEAIYQKKQQAIVDRIKQLLDQKGWTQRDLARKTGMKDSVISRILHGEANLTLRTIAELEAALGEKVLPTTGRLRD